tara:strand:- start:6336 stop:6842 length:507 start_codon:yes stop_codon:yes gene_type:complete
MNLIKVLPLFSVLPLLAASFSMPTVAEQVKTINKSDLYGSWGCQHEVEEPNTKMTIKVSYNINYVKNGTSNGVGALLFKVGGMPELKYSATDSSTWTLEGDNLTIKSNDINFKNVSHPELEALLNLKQILPTTINESGKILELSKTNLKVKSTSYGEVYSCLKAATAS